MRKGWDDDYKTCACARLVADGVPFSFLFLLVAAAAVFALVFFVLSLLFLGFGILMFGS